MGVADFFVLAVLGSIEGIEECFAFWFLGTFQEVPFVFQVALA